jgi:hypothetical protein
MQIERRHTEAASLAAFGAEAAALLIAGDISTLVQRYGYARALGRDHAAAIRADLASSLAEVGGAGLVAAERPPAHVSYFKPNDTGLFALVECRVPTDNAKSVLLELIVTSDGTSTHITLEDLSGVA